jgi:uncharacterized OB-fold protein
MPDWFDHFTDAIESDEQQSLVCGACGHGTLPPRRLCPACGSTELSREPLSGRGAVRSFTEISVTTPKFHGETPYAVVLVELDEGLTLAGQLREVTAEDVAIGDEVVLGTEPRDAGTAVLTFRPAEE